ncbi:MAG TPA: chemotaxis protein CheD [Spirochaetota bacterium]|nr:chemotaxis protein CheD [Spirochaetota bacterium]HPG52007.1 chemotaxis protein CheD [Spirochaetota bacterium]HPN13185.1 chemotaxis protein CheD [Spirochaetota bacterium]HQL83066.1 chemotaxis protein CheD [Spirochaetota bacterium]
MSDIISVGVAQIRYSSSPSVLRTILGSCVGICIYDRVKKIGGMAHVLLPVSQKTQVNPEKYADTAIPLLVRELLKEGAKKENMSAKITGGASMFKFGSNIALGQIGDRNIEQTKLELQKLGIPIVVEEVGGNLGRVIDFYLTDGHMKVKAGGQEKMYYKV